MKIKIITDVIQGYDNGDVIETDEYDNLDPEVLIGFTDWFEPFEDNENDKIKRELTRGIL